MILKLEKLFCYFHFKHAHSNKMGVFDLNLNNFDLKVEKECWNGDLGEFIPNQNILFFHGEIGITQFIKLLITCALWLISPIAN